MSAHVDLVVDGRNLTESAPPEPVLPLLRHLLTVWRDGGSFRFRNSPVTVVVRLEHGDKRRAEVVVGTGRPVEVDELAPQWLHDMLSQHLTAASEFGELQSLDTSAPDETLGGCQSRLTEGDAGCDTLRIAPASVGFEPAESTPLFSAAVELSWRTATRTPLTVSSHLPIQAHIASDDRLWVGRVNPVLTNELRQTARSVRRSTGSGDADDGPAFDVSSCFQLSSTAAVAALDGGDEGVLLVATSAPVPAYTYVRSRCVTPFFRRGAGAHIVTSADSGGVVLHHWHPTVDRWRSVELPCSIPGPVRHAAWCGDYLVVIGDDAVEVFNYDGHTLTSQWRTDTSYAALATQNLVPGLVALVAEDELVLVTAQSGKVLARLHRFWWTFEFGGIDRRGALHIVERSESGGLDHIRLPPETLLALVA